MNSRLGKKRKKDGCWMNSRLGIKKKEMGVDENNYEEKKMGIG